MERVEKLGSVYVSAGFKNRQSRSDTVFERDCASSWRRTAVASTAPHGSNETKCIVVLFHAASPWFSKRPQTQFVQEFVPRSSASAVALVPASLPSLSLSFVPSISATYSLFVLIRSCTIATSLHSAPRSKTMLSEHSLVRSARRCLALSTSRQRFSRAHVSCLLPETAGCQLITQVE